jgi:serine protease
MNLKVGIWRLACGFAIVGFGAAAARAQLAEVDPPAGPAGQPERYRDSGAWVEVERLASWQASPNGPLQDLRLRRGVLSFHASVGAQALVRLAEGASARTVFEREGLREIELASRRLRLYRVRGGSREDGVALAARLAGADGLISATPDLYLAHRAASRPEFAVPPDDEHYLAQWYLKLLDIESAWRLSSGDRATRVAIIDTGCDLDHPDLQGAFVQGRDLVDSDDDPRFTAGAKGNEHGTACAGIVGAVGNNGVGVVGVCPGCELICIRLFKQHSDLVPISRDIAAFDHALETAAAVVSNSWGFAEATAVPEPLRAIIEAVLRDGRDGRGAAVVFAAGNENRELLAEEIGAIPGVLNVGAVNNFEEAAPFSNFGPSVDLTAPNATYTTDIAGPDGEGPSDYTALFGGTSAACPVVAGVAALVLSAKPELTGRELADLLVATARPALYAQRDATGHDPIYGYGMVDPAVALRDALGLPPPPPPDAGLPAESDAGAADRDEDRDRGGCSVRAAGPSGPAHGLGLWVVVLAVSSRQRRVRA